ncbi:MAG: ImmA/IrrE family metallo-endopeptidase [Burkholderiales bacterium]|nr:ImmA/IrrE family metallo-endopeptidase [Burkholderiales bacterium]
MPIDPRIIARKLKQARELQSFSISAVSEATGIAAERLVLVEAGESPATGDEVLILANYYRHDFRDFLDDNRPAPFEKTDILYRRHGDAFTAEDRRAIQEFLYLCEIEAALEALLAIPKQSFSFSPSGTFFKAHGEPAARALRSRLGYATNEIPRDVFADFRRISVHIFRRRLVNSDISGLYIEHPIAGHCVLVNYDEDLYRQRFSASHEAAHAIFDSSEAVMVTFRRGSSKYDANDLREIRANRFASCYLMPPDQLPRLPQWTPDQVIEWAQRLRVSTTALSIALREAGIIDEATAATFRSVRVPSTEKIDPEAPENLTDRQRGRRIALLERGFSDHFVGLCFDAHQQGKISAGRLSEALLADHVELREISVLYGRSLQDGA